MTASGPLSVWQTEIEIATRGRGTYLLTPQIRQAVIDSGLQAGLLHLFCQHTSASVILCENADPEVRDDLETFMSWQVPDGDRRFRHQSEGPDDMPAHIRAILTGFDLTLPLSHGRLVLGTWQGVYLWEHRTHPHRRCLSLTISGC